MQKAVVVRATFDSPSGRVWSQAVDGGLARGDRSGGECVSLGDLLAEGWRVVHSCPMPSELDACCLVVVEIKTPQELAEPNDAPLTVLRHAAAAGDAGRGGVGHDPLEWDGETIPLASFGIRAG